MMHISVFILLFKTVTVFCLVFPSFKKSLGHSTYALWVYEIVINTILALRALRELGDT